MNKRPVILEAIEMLSIAAGLEDGDQHRYLSARNALQGIWKDLDHYVAEVKAAELVVDGSDYEAILEIVLA